MADRLSSSPLEALLRLGKIWRPFEELLQNGEDIEGEELNGLLLMRRAHEKAVSCDKEDFLLILDKRMSYFEVSRK